MVEYTNRQKSRQFDWLTELTNFTLVVEEEEAWEISLPAKKLLARFWDYFEPTNKIYLDMDSQNSGNFRAL